MAATRNGRRLGAGVAAALLASAGAAGAGEFDFNPYAAVQYMYDSNVYRFSSQVADVTGTTETADRSLRYLAGSDAGYTWQQQKLQVMGEVRHIRFDQFSYLDHSEYALGGAFDGAILSNTKVLLHARDERRMASFEDRRSTQLVIERDQTGRGEVAVAVTPAWQVVTGARGRNLRSPLPAAPALPQPPPGAPARPASPDFGMHEAGFNLGARYGIDNKEHPELEAPLLFGLVLDYQIVSFSGVTRQTEQPDPGPLPPLLTPPGEAHNQFQDYQVLTLQATMRYAVSGVSLLDAKLGLAQFNPERSSAESRPEGTGEVGYTRKVSPITEINAHLFRRIVPYVATADATTDSGISVGARWEPIRDLTVLGDYSWASSAFEGLSAFAPENAGRSDDVQNAALSVAYPSRKMFYVRLFSTFSDRKSNLGYNDYNDITAGVELSFRLSPLKPGAE